MVDMNALLTQQGQLFLLLALGVLFRRRGWLDASFQRGLTDLILYLVLPCNILHSFEMTFNDEILHQTRAILLVSALMQAGCILLAAVLYRRQRPDRRPPLQYATLCSNASFLGTPVVEGIFGGPGLLLAAVFLTPMRIAMWTVGLGYYTRGGGGNRWRKLALNPCIDAVVLGLVLLVTQWRPPAVLDRTIGALSSCNTGLSMLLIGMIIADFHPRDFLDLDVWYFSAVRLALIPGLTLLGCRLAGVDALVTSVSVVLAAMPAGGTTAILAAKYGGNAPFAAGCVTVSTVLSLAAIPLWCLVL